MGGLRRFIGLVGALPQWALPGSIARGIAKAQAALGMGDVNQQKAQGDQKKAAGQGMINASKQQANQAQANSVVVQGKATQWTAQGQQIQSQAAAQAAANANAQAQARTEAANIAGRIAALKAEIAQMKAAETAWASGLEGMASTNDAVAQNILNGTPIANNGATTLTPDQMTNLGAAKTEVDNCITFCTNCLVNGAVFTNNNVAMQTSSIVGEVNPAIMAAAGGPTGAAASGVATLQGSAAPAVAGRNADGVARQGLEDLEAIKAAIAAATPANYAELIARTFDTTSRVRSRLRALNAGVA